MAKSSRMTCSFLREVPIGSSKMIAGPGIHLRWLRFRLQDDNRSRADGKMATKLPMRVFRYSIDKAIEIKTVLDDYVIGQEHAKKVLSVAVYNHYKRLSLRLSKSLKSNC